MGVNGSLWDIFKPYVRREGFDFIRDKKVAVDLSFWVVQHETAIGSAVRNPHLRLTFFRTINLFVKFGAFPVFVVDGTPSHLKSQARIARFFRYSGVDLSSLPSSPDKGASAERNRAFTQCVQECVELVQLLGMPVLQAKGEAEALCAQLNSGGYVDACITADSDSFLFGANCVIKYIHPTSKDPFECYIMSDIEAGLGMSRMHLVAVSLLAGNDHDLAGIRGIGIETAVRFARSINEDRILESLEEIGRGKSPLLDNRSWFVALEEIGCRRTKVNPSHCSICGHPGSKQSHRMDSCGYCCRGATDNGCIKKPAGFKCGCLICDMERKVNEQRKDANWQMRVCKKISSGCNFPNPDIVDMYLNNDNGHFNAMEGPQLSWGAPDMGILVDYLVCHQNWGPSYIRQKMLPMMSTILLRERASSPTHPESSILLCGQYVFDSVLRGKRRLGQELYVVKWRRAGSRPEPPGWCREEQSEEDEEGEENALVQETPDPLDGDPDTMVLVDGGSMFLLTDENKALVQAAFPEQVCRFLEEKGGKEKGKKEAGQRRAGVQMSIKEFYRSKKMAFNRGKMISCESRVVRGEGSSSRPVRRRLEF